MHDDMSDEVTHELDQEMPSPMNQQAVVKKKQSLLSEVRNGNGILITFDLMINNTYYIAIT